MADVPHFSLPFRFVGVSPHATAGVTAAVNEQDSIDEIADCVLAILVCPQGYRVELPQFGVPDPTFSSPRVDTDLIRTLVDRWEPRAALQLSQNTDVVDELIAHVEALVYVQTQE